MKVLALASPEPHSYTNKDGVEVKTVRWLVEDIGASLQYASAVVTSNAKKSPAPAAGSGFSSPFTAASSEPAGGSNVDPWNATDGEISF